MSYTISPNATTVTNTTNAGTAGSSSSSSNLTNDAATVTSNGTIPS